MSASPGNAARTASATLIARDASLIADAAKIRFFPFTPVAGDGVRLRDADGRSILDFTAGWAVANVGYRHPLVRARIEAELARGTYPGTVSAALEPTVELAARLIDLVPVRGRSKVWFGHSGSDANEALARLVRRATGRPRIVTFAGSYHGSTDGSAALSGHTAQARWADHADDEKVPYPDAYRPAMAATAEDDEAAILARLEAVIAGDATRIAAVLVEPIQSDGGILVPSPAFLRGIEAICRHHGVLLAFDEVKVGLGRSGEWFAHQIAGVLPDFVVLGKALGGGLPLSAIVGPAEVLDVEPAIALFTTAGNPLSCAAGLGALEAIDHDDLAANALSVGTRLADRLRSLGARHALVGDVRGRGLVIGVELVRDRTTKEPAAREAARVCYRAAELGLAVFYVGMRSNVIEITPPLSITEAEAEEGVAILDQALDDVEAGGVPDDAIAGYGGW